MGHDSKGVYDRIIYLFFCFNQLQIHQMHIDQSWNMDLWIVCFDQESIYNAKNWIKCDLLKYSILLNIES